MEVNDISILTSTNTSIGETNNYGFNINLIEFKGRVLLQKILIPMKTKCILGKVIMVPVSLILLYRSKVVSSDRKQGILIYALLNRPQKHKLTSRLQHIPVSRLN